MATCSGRGFRLSNHHGCPRWSRFGNFKTGDILKDAAFSGATAGLTSGINLETLGINTKGLSENLIKGFGNGNVTLSGLLETGLDGIVSSGLSSIVYGTDFGNGVLTSLVTYIADGVAGAGIREVSDKTGHAGFSLEKLIAKATLNCIAAEVKGARCASGAVGTLVTEFIMTSGLTLSTDPVDIIEFKKRLEVAAAIAGYFTSGGRSENVYAAANAALLDYNNNALPLIVWGIAVLAGYVTYEGEGNPLEGLRTIGRGEDIVQVLMEAGADAAVGFSSEHFPDQTRAVLGVLETVGEAANVTVTYLDEKTGKTISTNWSKIPLSTREAILGGFTVASVVIPSSTAAKIANRLPHVAGKVPARVLTPIETPIDVTNGRSGHILANHRAGAGKPGKTEFPLDWDDKRIIHQVSDLATDPTLVRKIDNRGTPYVVGTRDGIEIRVNFYPAGSKRAGQISTAYPTNVPSNPRPR